MSRVVPMIALVVVGGSLLAGCGNKSYTYEVGLQVTGQGSAEVAVEYPTQPGNSDNKSPKSTAQQSTTSQTLPFHQKLLAAGLGHVSVSVQAADGQPVSCAITLEKDSPITKDGKGAVRCDADITESTDN
jgi:outer membrane murein-binding lipoprotein Lpp